MAQQCFRRLIRTFALVTVLFTSAYVIFINTSSTTPARRSFNTTMGHHRRGKSPSLVWIVHIEPQQETTSNFVNNIANDMDLINIGQYSDLIDHFIFSHNMTDKTKDRQTIKSVHSYHMANFDDSEIWHLVEDIEKRLKSHKDVRWFLHQKIISRQKRFFKIPQVSFMDFKDPYYKLQWHLTNTFRDRLDVNVTPVWRHNITGRGVTVAVVDDGVEWNNGDLYDNYNQAGSWDLNDNDPDPMPDPSKESNHHGTRCAGEISAIPNDICGVGVAYGAKFSGLRLLDGPLTDSLEADAFTKFLQVNDIYSCSWGPDDDGKTVDGPHHLAAAGMKKGIDFGRNGYGSIYVVASGNGGLENDNCNYDGYANSLYTVTIGAVDEKGKMPFYAEECASMLAVTFSSASGGSNRDIVTTDWTSALDKSRSGCTEHHSGTSAAAPIAAGLIALMLDVQPCLTWRDVQYLIILTAQMVDFKTDVFQWSRNAAGLWHSHKHGFGLMDAWRLTNAAAVWRQVPWQTSFMYSEENINLPITKGNANPLTISHLVSVEDVRVYDLYILETVYVTITLQHPCRGHLETTLISPHGTKSVIGAARHKDNSSDGFENWTFSTVRCWGETPVGNWTLQITDISDSAQYGTGTLISWSIKLFGTPMTPKQLQERRKTIEAAMLDDNLQRNPICPPPPVTAATDTFIAMRTLKVITMLGSFMCLFAIYETLEYLLCYNEEKKEQGKLMSLVHKAHRAVKGHLYHSVPDTDNSETQGLLTEDTDNSETQGLLTEDTASNSCRMPTENIPLQTFHDNRQDDNTELSREGF